MSDHLSPTLMLVLCNSQFHQTPRNYQNEHVGLLLLALATHPKTTLVVKMSMLSLWLLPHASALPFVKEGFRVFLLL
jgi:hypothetical protein